jgi:hypothetical protein
MGMVAAACPRPPYRSTSFKRKSVAADQMLVEASNVCAFLLSKNLLLPPSQYLLINGLKVHMAWKLLPNDLLQVNF